MCDIRDSLYNDIKGVILKCGREKFLSVLGHHEDFVVENSVGLLKRERNDYLSLGLTPYFIENYLPEVLELVRNYDSLLPLSHYGAKLYSWLNSSDYKSQKKKHESLKNKREFLERIKGKMSPSSRFSVSELFDSLLFLAKTSHSIKYHPTKNVWNNKRMGKKFKGDVHKEYVVNDKSFYESWEAMASLKSISANLVASIAFAEKYKLTSLKRFLLDLKSVKIYCPALDSAAVVSRQVNEVLGRLPLLGLALDDVFLSLYRKKRGDSIKGIFDVSTSAGDFRELRLEGYSLFAPILSGFSSVSKSYEELFVSLFDPSSFEGLVVSLVKHFEETEQAAVA